MAVGWLLDVSQGRAAASRTPRPARRVPHAASRTPPSPFGDERRPPNEVIAVTTATGRRGVRC
ncbi:hypothetical protein EYF80_030364 [Liparis tanakae]|uniref:Uncharacterized protein n=1 Tax=Liparis tanakae TaxID=230148 RepID=A0A4Z2H109_9TELE|nr:hypothetical protein EYF80_030364 [Liparis tanakae]